MTMTATARLDVRVVLDPATMTATVRPVVLVDRARTTTTTTAMGRLAALEDPAITTGLLVAMVYVTAFPRTRSLDLCSQSE